MIKLLTDKDMLARITPAHCEAALHRAKQTHQFPYNVLAQMVGVPERIGKRALRQHRRDNK